jgi:hypothetical protein
MISMMMIEFCDGEASYIAFRIFRNRILKSTVLTDI